jgi:hypothetical protein
MKVHDVTVVIHVYVQCDIIIVLGWCPSFFGFISDTINPLKTKLVYILFKNSVRTSKRKSHFIITKINWLMLFNRLKTKLVYILFKSSVRTSKRTPHFTITKINWLTLFKFKRISIKFNINSVH